MKRKLYIYGVTYKQNNGDRKVRVVTTKENLDELATFADDINFSPTSEPVKIIATERQHHAAATTDFREFFKEEE